MKTNDDKTAEQLIRNGIAFLKSLAKQQGWVLHVKLDMNPAE